MKRNLIVLTIALLALGTPFIVNAADAKTETGITYVGERFWFTANLDGFWVYGISDDGNNIDLQWRSLPGIQPRRMRWIKVRDVPVPANWPTVHSESWAADAYMRPELDESVKRISSSNPYKIYDYVADERDVAGLHFHTRQAILAAVDRNAEDLAFHEFYYLHFPDDYAHRKRFFVLAYVDLRQAAEMAPISPELLHDVIAGFSLDNDNAPFETTVTWSEYGGEHVVLSALGSNRSYYFYDNPDGLCARFSIEGIWYPTDEPGLLQARDRDKQVGALIFSDQQLEHYKGKDLQTRAATCQKEFMEDLRRKKAKKSTITEFDCRFPDTIRWEGIWPFKMYGQKLTAQVVRYITEVRPGWVVVVTSSAGAGGDNTARAILESLEFADGPNCFADQIAVLKTE